MIKIQNNLAPFTNTPLNAAVCRPEVIECLRDADIDLGRHAHPDFTFVSANDSRHDRLPERAICFERIDGPQIRHRRHLKNPNCLRLVKMYMFASRSVTDLACVEGRPLTRFLIDNEDNVRKPDVPLTDEEKSKVVLGPSFLNYVKFDGAERFSDELNGIEKNIDVFFVGTLNYGKHGHDSGALISRHRHQCREQLQALKTRRPDLEIVLPSERQPQGTYMEFMAKARITVSPWGWGDACYRDYEALLCQTEVIKPQGYPVRSIPDIYMQPGDCIHYVPPTWEGMEATIDGILQTWDERQEARQTMRDVLKRWRRPEAVAEILSGIVAGVM